MVKSKLNFLIFTSFQVINHTLEGITCQRSGIFKEKPFSLAEMCFKEGNAVYLHTALLFYHLYRIGSLHYFNFFLLELSMPRLRDGRPRRGKGHRPLRPLHAAGLRPDQSQHESFGIFFAFLHFDFGLTHTVSFRDLDRR
jgi:hypothetical protein